MARTAFLCLVVALLALFSSTTADWSKKKCTKKLNKADKKWDNQIAKMVDKGCDPVPSVPGYPIPGDELLGSISDGTVPLHSYAKVVMQNVANDATTLTAMATGCDDADAESDAAIVDLGTVDTQSAAAIVDLATVDTESAAAIVDLATVDTESAAAIVDLATVDTESAAAIVDLATVDTQSAAAIADLASANTDFAAAAAAGDVGACKTACAAAKVHSDDADVHIDAAKAAGLAADVHVDAAKAAGVLADAHVDAAKAAGLAADVHVDAAKAAGVLADAHVDAAIVDIAAVKTGVVLVQKTDNYPARSGAVPSEGEFHYELGCVCTGAKTGYLGRISTKVQKVNMMDATAPQTDAIFNTQTKCATTLTQEKGICSSKTLEACKDAATDNFNVGAGQTVKVEILGC